MADFKKKKTKIFRRRKQSFSSDDDSEGDSAVKDVLEDTKELQKLRKRKKGVDLEDLSAVKNTAKPEVVETDPYKMKTGGIIDLKQLQKSDPSLDDEEAIGTTFAAETNRRDEDADMLKYVEKEMNKRKGHVEEDANAKKKTKTAEDSLYDLPDHLQVQSAHKRTEDMLSNQMLSGIPEVDLGLEAKIKNLEETENAKQQLLEERMRKKDKAISDFVPTNMAVNFMQHNRFNIEDTAPILPKKEAEAKPQVVVRIGDDVKALANAKRPLEGEKSTDDYHYEKFKKHARRH